MQIKFWGTSVHEKVGNWDGSSKPIDKPEFGKAAEAYAKHRLGFPQSMYIRLCQEGVMEPGMKHLDLGTGTGTLARTTSTMGLLSTGLDIDKAMLTAARKLAIAAGLNTIFREGNAENTSENTESHDLVTAGQCWHWFDRPNAAAEAFRILKPGGKLAMCHYDWVPYGRNIPLVTEEVVADHNPDWQGCGGNGIYPHWARDLTEAGFTDIKSFSYDEAAIYSHEAWVFRMEASSCAISLSPEKRDAFKEALANRIKKDFPEEPLNVDHRVFCIWGTKPT